MANSSAPPRRRAIRSLIGLAVVVALAVWWIQTPGIDPRFVGSWSVVKGGPGMPPTPPASWILESNGVGRRLDQRNRPEVSFPWRVDGDSIVLGRGPIWASGAMEAVNAVFGRVFRWLPFAPPLTFKIVDVSEQGFVLRHAGGLQMTFTRVPDITVVPRSLSDQNRVLMSAGIAALGAVFVWWSWRRRRRASAAAVPTGS